MGSGGVDVISIVFMLFYVGISIGVWGIVISNRLERIAEALEKK
jgi:hypothetical protein